MSKALFSAFLSHPRMQMRWFSNTVPGAKPLTIKEVRNHLMAMVGVREKFGSQEIIPGDEGVMQKVVKSQSELQKRTPQDSYVQAIIPLSNAKARDKYLYYRPAKDPSQSSQGIRFGRLLEDFDTLAGLVCYNHNKQPDLGEKQKSPYAFVTALVDRIEMSTSAQLSPFRDIYMEGKTTWVGRSSMECTMRMSQEIDGKMHQMVTAKYLFVARDVKANKAGVVNPLDPQTPEDKELYQLAENNKNTRVEEGKKSLLKTPPDEKERLLIHELFLSTIDLKSGTLKVQAKPENTVWMDECILKSLNICHPEQRNLYNKIFGGFLMRKAYELAWANSTLFTKSRPKMCKTVDDIVFKKPVEVGSVLFLSSQIVYTKGPDVQVHVHAEVVDPEAGTHDTTNDFQFTFDSGVPNLPQVMPKTYAEAMMYLVGKRHYGN